MFNRDQVLKQFEDALQSFVDKVKTDPSVICVLLEGSLAYDKVWEKSDMDVVLVVREQKLNSDTYCVFEDGIPINVHIMTRQRFKQMLEGSHGGGTEHSMFARAKIVYSTDDSLFEALENARAMGDSDIEQAFFLYACWLLGLMEKAEKWLVVKNDVRYAQFYILKCAEPLASMALVLRGISPNREAVLAALEREPALMEAVYLRPLAGAMTEEAVRAALQHMNAFLDEHLDILSNCADRYMKSGEIVPVTVLAKLTSIGVHGIAHVFDYLCEKGVCDRATQTIRLTPKGKKIVEEAAYLYTKDFYQ